MAIQELSKDVQSLIRSSISVPSVPQAVTELVLNSIDAGATFVDVYVDLKYFKIRVVDNGSGMTQDQLDLICQRYMTSKCHSLEDLKNGLQFFGFRGEALASIRDASGVLSIISKHGISTQAYSKMFVRGVPLKISPYTMNKMDCGTTVIVQDFMYNLPVRQKCTHETLDVEEIKRQMECIALVHPQISFSLHDECKGGKILQKHKSADLHSCFSHLFGMAVGQTLAPLAFLEAIEKETSENQSSDASSDEEPFTLHIKRAFHGVPARRGGILQAVKKSNKEDTSHATTNNPKYTDKYITEVAVKYNIANSCNKFLNKQETVPVEPGITYKKLTFDAPDYSTHISLASSVIDPNLDKNSEPSNSVPMLSEFRAVTPNCNSSDIFTVQQKLCCNLGKETSQEDFYSLNGKEMTVFGDETNSISYIYSKELRDINSEASDGQIYNNCLETVKLKDKNYMTTEEFIQTSSTVSKQYPPVSSVMGNSKSLQSKKYFSSNTQMPKTKQKKMKENEKHSSFVNAEEFIHTHDKELSLESQEQDQTYPSVCKRKHHEQEIADDENSSHSPAFNSEDYNITQGIQVTHLKEEALDKYVQNKVHQNSTTKSLILNDTFCLGEGDLIPTEVVKSPYFKNDRGFLDNEKKAASPNTDVTHSAIYDNNLFASNVYYHTGDYACDHLNYFLKGKENRKRSSYNECDAPSEKQRLLEMKKVNDVINLNIYFDKSYNRNLLEEERVSDSSKEQKFPTEPEKRDCEELLNNEKSIDKEISTTSTSSVDTTQTFHHYSPEEGVTHLVVNEKSEEIEIPQQGSSNHMTNSEKENEINKSPYWLQMFDSSGKAFYVHSDSGVTSYSAPETENDKMKYTVEGRYSFLPKGMSPGVQSTVMSNKSELKLGTRQELHKILLNDVSSTNELANAEWRNAVGSESGESKKLVKKLLVDAENRLKYSRKPDESLYEKKLAKLAGKVSQIMYPTEYNKNIFHNMHVVGQCDKKFIIVYCSLVEDKEPHVIGAFDQHAVHERIRLETLMKGYMVENKKHTFKATELESEILLPLNSKDCRIMKNFEEEFRRLGISYEVLNNNCVNVKKVPTCLYNREMRENSRKSSSIERFLKCLISDHAEVLLETRGACFGIPGVLQEIINYEACRGAIKFGEELALEECKTLIKNLAKCDQPFMCAHGRPTFGVIFDVEQMNKTVKIAVNKLGLKT